MLETQSRFGCDPKLTTTINTHLLSLSKGGSSVLPETLNVSAQIP